MSLEQYRAKRNFNVSSEPAGNAESQLKQKRTLLFVVQKHRATQLHYDFRLELNGTLLSWAVPKGPSTDPSVKRLAMQVEDHPMEYANFEGVIPEGEYGGGTVMVWDTGKWTPEIEDAEEGLKKGDLKFNLQGKKLKGSWVLVRTHGFGSRADKSWLLIKHKDEFASKKDIVADEPRSVLSHKLLADIARDNGGNVEKAAAGDPVAKTRKVAAARKRKRLKE